jgi:transcriptional regulator with XRE-family HTH domain
MINRDEKHLIKMKLGLCLRRILDERKNLAKERKLEGIKDHKLISSLRKLEAATGLRFATLQEISVGKTNASITSIAIIAETLDMSLSQFFSYYDKITEDEVNAEIDKRKNKRKSKRRTK